MKTYLWPVTRFSCIFAIVGAAFAAVPLDCPDFAFSFGRIFGGFVEGTVYGALFAIFFVDNNLSFRRIAIWGIVGALACGGLGALFYYNVDIREHAGSRTACQILGDTLQGLFRGAQAGLLLVVALFPFVAAIQRELLRWCQGNK
jgi:hypothetical protein